MKHSDLHKTVKIGSIVKLVFHALGLSSLLCSVLLSIFTFSNILGHGYFLGYEPDQRTLQIEFGLCLYGLVYFTFLLWQSMRDRLRVHFKGEAP